MPRIRRNLSKSNSPPQQSQEALEAKKVENSDTSDKQIEEIETKDATLLKILPQLTDREIDDWLEPHYVATSKNPFRRQQLLLFLSGSYGKPGRQLLLMKEAIELGYHAINLCYPNSWTVAELCQGCEDKNCHEKVRLEIIKGHKYSDKINISRPNSLENRLVKLLQYLDQQHPEESWQQYYHHNSPCWESIAVAGHSQGGGHAAMIAKENLVSRVIMFGSPADYNPILQSLAPWLEENHATPVQRYYSFAHLQDPGYAKFEEAWRCLGMSDYGSVVNVGHQPSPYNYSHCLVTQASPARPRKYHGCVVSDLQTPRLLDGTPRFREVWQYLLDASW